MKHSPPQVTGLAAKLAAVCDPLRLRVCRALEREELNVGELAAVFQLPQSTMSRHLKQLAGAGWVQRRAEGTATLFRLSLDDLDDPARTVWTVLREQAAEPRTLEEDDRRLKTVLAERQLDSKAYFGQVAGEWDDIRQNLFGQGFTAPALLALLDPTLIVADLGCGTGNAAAVLAPHVARVIAVDQSQPMLDAARRRLAGRDNVEFREGTLDRLPLPDASVDATVAILVLHHLAQVQPALREMRRVLRPGGTALVLDMLPHERTDFRHRMGHAHLGFERGVFMDMLASAGLTRARLLPLTPRPDAKGPSLFVATARAGPQPGGEA